MLIVAWLVLDILDKMTHVEMIRFVPMETQLKASFLSAKFFSK
jgi:hypothetical protein